MFVNYMDACERFIFLQKLTYLCPLGIKMPEVLRPWLPPNIQEEIPFIHPPVPRDSENPKNKKAKK